MHAECTPVNLLGFVVLSVLDVQVYSQAAQMLGLVEDVGGFGRAEDPTSPSAATAVVGLAQRAT